MGMMLRRNNRKPDYTPQVNGKSVVKEPKKRSLTATQPQTVQYSKYNYNEKK